MTGNNTRLIGAAASLLIAAAAAGTTIGASQASASDGPLSCALEVSRAGGMVAIDGLASAKKATTGTYSFTVRGGGTNIRQGGEFEARSGETVTLGQVAVGNGTYDVRLEVKAGGRTASCSERIGSI